MTVTGCLLSSASIGKRSLIVSSAVKGRLAAMGMGKPGGPPQAGTAACTSSVEDRRNADTRAASWNLVRESMGTSLCRPMPAHDDGSQKGRIHTRRPYLLLSLFACD